MPSSFLPTVHPSFFPSVSHSFLSPSHSLFLLSFFFYSSSSSSLYYLSDPPPTLVSTFPIFISTSAPFLFFSFPPFSFSLSLSSGLSKDGGGSANAESLEEVLNILAEEGSDWIYGFFTFLYDVVSSPVDRGEEEEEGKEAAAEMQEEGGGTSSDDGEVKGVVVDLQNQ